VFAALVLWELSITGRTAPAAAAAAESADATAAVVWLLCTASSSCTGSTQSLIVCNNCRGVQLSSAEHYLGILLIAQSHYAIGSRARWTERKKTLQKLHC